MVRLHIDFSFMIFPILYLLLAITLLVIYKGGGPVRTILTVRTVRNAHCDPLYDPSKLTTYSTPL